MLASGDTLLVTRLDRLARSTRDLLNILDSLSNHDAAFHSVSDPWADTTTAHERLMLTVLGGLAEFGRELIQARTGEGRARAVARGQNMGRPLALTRHQIEDAIKDLQSGASTQADLARRFNISQSTILRLTDSRFANSRLTYLQLANSQISDKTNLHPVALKLYAETERAVRAFMQRIAGRYSVREVLRFGSRARHIHTVDSDADIAVVLNGENGNRAAAVKDMAGIEFHVIMETGVMVEALPLWDVEIKRQEIFSNPSLIRNIAREGIRL